MKTSYQENRTWQKIEYPELGLTINAALNVPDKQIVAHIRENCKRGLPQVWPHATQDTEVVICAGGPSLNEGIEEIRQLQKKGAKVIAIANTAKLLLDNGINPVGHVILDAREGNVNFLTGTECTYFVSSQCNPKVFDRLKDKKVFMWHAINTPEEVEVIKEHYESWVPIQGGNTITLRALRLFQVLGYYRFHLFGMDSCNIEGKHHAYAQPAADDMEEIVIGLNGRPFKCTAWQIQQAMEFMKMVKAFGQDWEMQVYGNGLISHMIKEGGNNGIDSLGDIQ